MTCICMCSEEGVAILYTSVQNSHAFFMQLAACTVKMAYVHETKIKGGGGVLTNNFFFL